MVVEVCVSSSSLVPLSVSGSMHGAFRRLLVWVSQVLLCSGCTLEIQQPQGGFWDQYYDFSCELASPSMIPAQSVLLGLDALLLFVYSRRNFITVPLGMNWLPFLCMLGTEPPFAFQALGNLSLTLQNGACLFIHVFIYSFIYLSWQVLPSLYTKGVLLGFVSLKVLQKCHLSSEWSRVCVCGRGAFPIILGPSLSWLLTKMVMVQCQCEKEPLYPLPSNFPVLTEWVHRPALGLGPSNLGLPETGDHLSFSFF